MSRLFISLILLPLLLLAGCGPDKDSPVYQRKQAFKQMMRHKGGNVRHAQRPH